MEEAGREHVPQGQGDDHVPVEEVVEAMEDMDISGGGGAEGAGPEIAVAGTDSGYQISTVSSAVSVLQPSVSRTDFLAEYDRQVLGSVDSSASIISAPAADDGTVGGPIVFSLDNHDYTDTLQPPADRFPHIDLDGYTLHPRIVKDADDPQDPQRDALNRAKLAFLQGAWQSKSFRKFRDPFAHVSRFELISNSELELRLEWGGRRRAESEGSHLLPSFASDEEQILFLHGQISDLDRLLRQGFDAPASEAEGAAASADFVKVSKVIYPNFRDGILLLCRAVGLDSQDRSPGGTTIRASTRQVIPFAVVHMKSPDFPSLTLSEVSPRDLARQYTADQQHADSMQAVLSTILGRFVLQQHQGGPSGGAGAGAPAGPSGCVTRRGTARSWLGSRLSRSRSVDFREEARGAGGGRRRRRRTSGLRGGGCGGRMTARQAMSLAASHAASREELGQEEEGEQAVEEEVVDGDRR